MSTPPRDGENNPNSKLTSEDIRVIRLAHRQLIERLAREYDITYPHLHRIIRGRRWGNIPEAQPS